MAQPMGARVKEVTSGEDNVAVEVLADVNVALHDRVEGSLVDAGCLHAHHGRREEHLGAAEALAANRDHLRFSQWARSIVLLQRHL